MRRGTIVIGALFICLISLTAHAEIMVGTGYLAAINGSGWNGTEFRSEDGKTTLTIPESSINKVILVKPNNTLLVTRSIKEMAERQQLPRTVVRIIRDENTMIIIE